MVCFRVFFSPTMFEAMNSIRRSSSARQWKSNEDADNANKGFRLIAAPETKWLRLGVSPRPEFVRSMNELQSQHKVNLHVDYWSRRRDAVRAKHDFSTNVTAFS